MKYIIVILMSYLIGSIPFSYLLGKVIYKKDIRSLGSKNPGSTNVFRNFGPKAGIATLIFDIGKGFFAVGLTKKIYDEKLALFALVFVILGHIFSIFLNFKGGKGVATSAGSILAYDYRVLLILLTIFLVIFLLTRTVSKASISAAILAPIIAFYFYGFKSFTLIILIMGLTVVYEHRANIKRILNHEEKKMF